MRVVVNSPKSLSLSVLKTKFLPHCRGNLWNRLLCQANLYWQPPAGTHAPARTMPACGLKSSMMSWVFPSLFSNLDWLASTHSLPTPQGHLRCRQRRRDRSERSPIRGMNSRGEWKEEAGLISSCQKKSWKPCFFFLFFSPPDFLFLFWEASSGILSLISFCRAKLDYSLEKHNSLSTLEPGPHRRRFIWRLWWEISRTDIFTALMCGRK